MQSRRTDGPDVIVPSMSFPMPDDTAEHVTIQVDGERVVSGLLQTPASAFAGLVLAHGAGAGMTHRFLAAVANGLEAGGVATLRFQFPYMEGGSKRPDRPALAQAAVRSAAEAARHFMPGLPLFAGGKSFGARMTSQAQAEAPLPDVRGLVLLGFPLHAANKPGDDRARHLALVRIPMLFLQGTRDALADVRLLVPVVDGLGAGARLQLVADADHAFHVPARTGRTDIEVLDAMLGEVIAWLREIVDRGPSPT